MKLKILTFNIHKGYSLFNTKFLLHEIKRSIDKSGADICLLQELVGEDYRTSKIKKLEKQLEFMADEAWPYSAYGKNAVFPRNNHGNAILSSLPIIKINNVSLTVSKLEHRGLLHVQVKLPNSEKALHILNTHLNLITGDRIKQVKKIIDYMKAHIDPQDAIVLGGDFNDWNYKVDRVLIKSLRLSECNFYSNKKWLPTFPSFYPILSLDRLYVKNLKILNSQVLFTQPWKKLSDHLPILADLEF